MDKTAGQKEGANINAGLTTNSGPIFEMEFENRDHFSHIRTDFSELSNFDFSR